MEANKGQVEEVYLLARSRSSSVQKFIKINDSRIMASFSMWIIYSGTPSHMTLELASFSYLQYTKRFSVEIGEKPTMIGEGGGEVKLCINVLECRMKGLIQDVL